MAKDDVNSEYIILSGYQMLHENLKGGGKGTDRIDASKEMVKKWTKSCPNNILHLEVASTQDRVIRKHLIDSLVESVDSLGFKNRWYGDFIRVGLSDDTYLAKYEKNRILVKNNLVNVFLESMR